MGPHNNNSSNNSSTSTSSDGGGDAPAAAEELQPPRLLQPQQQLMMSLNTRMAWRAVGAMAACAAAVLGGLALLLKGSGLGESQLLAVWCAAEAVFAAD